MSEKFMYNQNAGYTNERYVRYALPRWSEIECDEVLRDSERMGDMIGTAIIEQKSLQNTLA